MFQPMGIIPALVTPFTEAEEINERALRQLVRRVVKGGVHGVFALGTNGEFFALSFEEKVQIAKMIVDEVAGKVPVYMGAGGITTRETIQLAEAFADAGVDALSVITPYFLGFSQQELIDHYTRLAEATSLPIVLYNIPARTGNSLNPGTVAQLAKIPGIVGIKDSSGNIDNTLKYMSGTAPQFSVLAGTDSLILPVLMSGGHGAIAATANLLPEVVVSIYDHWKAGELAKAQEAQSRLAPIRNLFPAATLPAVLKEALNLTGIPVGPARRPVGRLNEQVRSELAKVLQGYAAEGLVELA
jgi:4-hydroxy-tetrahydrodipicolinate synthase